ncbi:NifB/NifX family molybdenum-iron cluster-binding protein [Blastochloris tepida]|uniref:Nitrogen fixation n=1 Tax=Blastochloris tepida TaxID=2233851 RepID=A0A348G397_9HYPH|nr:NifB/NifX family molybdenum-iron cluster-binding protein [Blastochloris tepida]BBF94030.1 nitrogen fixation [Blastochloris tepida]
MRIAVASQNFRTVTPHAGKSRRFLVFEAEAGSPPREVERLDLPKDMSIHEYRGTDPHPLYSMQAVIAASAGPGFVARLASVGVAAIATSETDPVAAVEKFLAGTLPQPAEHEDDCDCNCH